MKKVSGFFTLRKEDRMLLQKITEEKNTLSSRVIFKYCWYGQEIEGTLTGNLPLLIMT